MLLGSAYCLFYHGKDVDDSFQMHTAVLPRGNGRLYPDISWKVNS